MALSDFAEFTDLQDYMPGVTLDAGQCALLLAIASETIRTATHQQLSFVEDDEVTVDLDGCGGGRKIWLHEMPLVSVASVVIEAETVDPSAYRAHRTGEIRFESALSRWGAASTLGRQAVVTNTHGYEEIPADIKGLCLDLARRGINLPPSGVKQETIEQFSVTYDLSAARQLTELDRIVLGGYTMPLVA